MGPPPLTGSVLRLAGLSGSLAVYLAAVEDTVRVQVVSPSGEPAATGPIGIDGQTPEGKGFSIFPRPCGTGCGTAAFQWPLGTSTVAVTVRAAQKEWGGGTVRFSVPWPPQPEDPGLLQQVMATIGRLAQFVMVERVSSGPGASAQRTYTLTGQEFTSQEVYVSGATDVRPLPAPPGERALSLYLPASSIWYRLEIDGATRLKGETIVSPGHQIVRSFSYPAG